MQKNVAMGGQRRLSNTPMSEAEQKTRIELAACYRLARREGWDELIYNHISARVPGPEHHFLINPFGLAFEEVTASNLVKVDLDGTIIGESPYPINAAGFTIHSAVHAARPEVGCVIHLHTEAGMALSMLEGVCCRCRRPPCSSRASSPFTTMKASRSTSPSASGWCAIWATRR